MPGAPAAADKPMIGITEFARLTGLAENTIRFELERGRWPGVRVGKKRSWRVPRAVAEAVVRGQDPATMHPPAVAPTL